ncbi:MAG: hypothetical protein J6D41_15700, partial [Clostridium sp.]|nr:hypothetical protein [Clostridium sp.]
GTPLGGHSRAEDDFADLDDDEDDEDEIQVGTNINLVDTDNAKMQLEDEIKKYALEKPGQVIDIIRAWMNEDER